IQGVSESSTSSQQDQANPDCIVMPIWKDASYFDDALLRYVANAQIQDQNGLHDEIDVLEKTHDDSSLQNNGTADQQVNIATPEDLVGPSPASEDSHVEDQEIELGNIPQSYEVPTTSHTRIHKDHLIEHVIGDVQSFVQTRRMKTSYSETGFLSAIDEGKTHQDLHTCLFVEAMQEELLQFKLQKVWILVDLPKGHRAIGTKWVYRNKKDERGIVIRNKARIVAQGHTQEEGIDYNEKVQLLRCEVCIYSPPTDLEKPLVQDGDAADVDEHLYRSMIRSLMYLTTSRPDIMFAVCACARTLVKGKPSLGLWYSKDSPLELVAYTDSDYAGATQDRKSTIGGCSLDAKTNCWTMGTIL
ncbi:putative ribonuclease H-like domain-containing protein, partial [Tanacetum coccineum]